MAEVITLKDANRRGPSGFPIHCRVCWHGVYVLWCDKTDHKGACINGATHPHDCPDEMARSRQTALFVKLRAMGFSGADLWDPKNWALASSSAVAKPERAQPPADARPAHNPPPPEGAER
jgi:hypothetical protein